MRIGLNRNHTGSFTVEAAVATPLFFFAVLAFLYLLQWQQMYENIEYALVETARESSQYAYAADGNVADERAGDEKAGDEKVVNENAVKIGGALYLQTLFRQYSSLEGVSLTSSSYLEADDEIIVTATYHLAMPIPVFHVNPYSMEQKVKSRGFTGRSMLGDDAGEAAEDVVYVTETGSVYHTNRMCTHLQLKIQSVDMASVEDMRNRSGARYKACERCVKGAVDGSAAVCIADYGDRYHIRRDCPGLTRTVYEKTLEEVQGMAQCKKCSQR